MMQVVSRYDLNTLPPGLYQLQDRHNDDRNLTVASADGDRVMITGRVLALVRESSELPTGVLESWVRGDGKAVVLTQDAMPYFSTAQAKFSKVFLGLEKP